MIERGVPDVYSPNGGSVVERENLSAQFGRLVSVNDYYSRKLVSYQGNRDVAGFRWLKYKEGFSSHLVKNLVEKFEPQSVLDPFAGICTTPLVASGLGREAMGIEIMPVGVLAGTAITEASNGLSPKAFEHGRNALLGRVRSNRSAPQEFAFPHVRITAGAFTQETEEEIAKARSFIASIDDASVRSLLDLACLSVLEEASFTRKDGQYLRWDHRADRPLRSTKNLGPISRFDDALEKQLDIMAADIDLLKELYGGGRPNLVTGSCLELLKDIPDGSFDMVLTSPPYANRYDYTRTYALELAWMGFDQDDFVALRQRMLSATVENKEKIRWLENLYGDKENRTLVNAIEIYSKQAAVHEVLAILRQRESELSNRNILTLIEQYFFEMALVVAELGRIVRPGGVVVMVNDNVQYHGEELPVDFILADFAEQSGFKCANIWKLRKGKGNSSQQMGRFGRRELRKCIYLWVRENG